MVVIYVDFLSACIWQRENYKIIATKDEIKETSLTWTILNKPLLSFLAPYPSAQHTYAFFYYVKILMTCSLMWNGVNTVCSSIHTINIFLDKKLGFEHMYKHVYLLIRACTHKQAHTVFTYLISN